MAVHRLFQRILSAFSQFLDNGSSKYRRKSGALISSGMDDASYSLTAAATANRSLSDYVNGDDAAAEEEDGEEFCDVETWETLSKSFREVQSVLEHNRRLIQQVNDNHRSKIPHDLAQNVGLICEINSNMSKVIGLYSNLSANLSSIVQNRRGLADKAMNKVES